ncbi:hypothetical protein DFP72DRAFT_1066599 [Ephemerocybe angulata]|uniref:Oxidoreductase AflY n=1 Tax=Ephemerocybe angulata TaxID=980116 RepID=A0A8H6I126_9AGAR|nr:hypothetical protein DFP72DRAFT_1066599 [Tulosesus angulatus]
MSSTSFQLFPDPSHPPARLSPPHWPGISPASTQVLQDVLKHNHEHWHTFINEKHFHNHAPHRALALWGLGADGDVIRAGYEKDCDYEKPKITPPGAITQDNWTSHLGDERYYRAYLDFFTDSLRTHGISPTLETYLFSSSANVDAGSGKHPQMMARLFSGVFHPVIHTGYGLEFGLPGMTAEGLAQAAVHAPATAPLVPSSLFDSSTYNTLDSFAESAGKGLNEALGSAVQSLDAAWETILPKNIKLPPSNSSTPSRGTPAHLEDQHEAKDVHALDILGWVSKDMRFSPSPDERDSFDESIGKHARAVIKFSRLWKLDIDKLANDQAYLDGKIEELAFVVAVMYGIGGWTGRGKNEDGSESLFNADFFLMHLVTSSIFIPSYCAYLSPLSTARFLQTYLTVALAMYVFRGCPPFDIPGFYHAEEPQPVGPQPHPGKGTLPSPESGKAVNPDPWLPIIQTSVVHPDEHVPKTQRALANWAGHFGTRRFRSVATSASEKRVDGASNAAESAGFGMGWAGEGWLGDGGRVPLELEGAEWLDGTVFLRAAEFTAARMGRVREGEDGGQFWDFKGFYERQKEEVGVPKAHL